MSAPRPAPRRIVAAAGPDGRSRVVADDALPAAVPGAMNIVNLWTAPAPRVRNDGPLPASFPPFGMHQLTDAVYSVMLAEYAPGLGAADPGMHYTDTADHFHVLEGEVVLVLEEGEAVLRAGDTGIIRGAVHGWRNDTAAPARLITFVLPAQPLERGA